MTTATKPEGLSLYELSEEQVALDALYAMDQGEVTPESELLEQELIGKMVTKADSFGAFLRERESRCDVIDAEIARLTARKRTYANQVNSLKTYGLLALQRMDRPKIEGTLYTLALQNNPPKVEITVGVEALPPEFVRVVPERKEIDRVAVLTALKAGTVVDGCEIVRTQSLRVR